MAELSVEIIAKLKKANSIEEVTELLKADGQDENEAQKIWKELENLRAEEGKELSLDELESVAGGLKHRDWLEDGCAATVEPGSDCWHTDGGCSLVNIKYSNKPSPLAKCPVCGAYSLDIDGNWYTSIIQCRIHGKWQENRAGTWTWTKLDD